MRRRVHMGAAAALLVLFALTGLGCKPPSHPERISEITAPRKFDFSMTQDVTVKMTVTNRDGNVLPGSVVTVGGADNELVPGNIFARGMTNEQGRFERVIRVPARYDALRVQALVSGVAHGQRVSIQDNEVSVTLETES